MGFFTKSRRSMRTVLGCTVLEDRFQPATLAGIGTTLTSFLGLAAAADVVTPALAPTTHASLQSDVVGSAANRLETRFDTVLKTAASQLGNLNGATHLGAGYRIDLAPGAKAGQPVAHLTIDETVTEAASTVLKDGRTGFEEFDAKFAGDYKGIATLRDEMRVAVGVTVRESADGQLTAAFDDGSRIEMNRVHADIHLDGRGVFGELPDVLLHGIGSVDGSARIAIRSEAGAVRGSADVNLTAGLDTSATSKDPLTEGVTWSIRDDSGSANAAAKGAVASSSKVTPPSALSLLRSAVQRVDHYRIDLPDSFKSLLRTAANVKIPFTGDTLGDKIDFAKFLPVVVSTINPNAYATFNDLARALSKDKRFHVLMKGDADALRYAQGYAIRFLSIDATASSDQSLTLAKASSQLMVYPGIILSGSATLSLKVTEAINAHIFVDTIGIGIGEGSNASLAVGLDGGLKGSVDILGFGKYTLLGADATADAVLQGKLTATLGRSSGSGIWYVGTAASNNPPRNLADYLSYTRSIEAGVHAKVKVTALYGLFSYTVKKYNKDWTIAKDTHNAIVMLTPISR